MQITRLELIDYKCFEHLVLENLGSRIVLVGPNGCGKSAVLEGIAVVKEYVGTYNPQRDIYQGLIAEKNVYGQVWHSKVPLPIRGDQRSATINMTLTLNEEEYITVGGIREIEVGIIIHHTREVNLLNQEENVRQLFRDYDPKLGIGVFDYIAPDRQFAMQQVKQLDISRLSLDQQRKERIELPNPESASQKFAAIKHFIITEQLNDTSIRNTTGENHDSIKLLKELFHYFFGPKVLIGAMQRGDELQVVVRTPYGDHDIDQLSSGERELFTIFTNLFRIRNLPSVILYDEPERHLNPGLESKLIPALDRLETKNQLWISTHGSELIGSVPMNQIIALKREAGRSLPERFTDESRTQRVRLLEAVGVSVGLQLASNRIVFLEGEDASADKRILDRIAGPLLPGVLFVASGSSADVEGAGTRAGLLLEQASKDAAFIMVLDRDYRDDNNVAGWIKRLNNRAFVWSCHEVENLLLDASVLRQVLCSNGFTDTFASDEGVQQALLEGARRMATRFTIELATYRLHSAVNLLSSGSPQDEDGYRATVQSRYDRLEKIYSQQSTEAELAAAKFIVNQCLEDGTWATLLPGKEILDEFRRRYIAKLPGDLFREQIVSRMVERSVVPTEVERLCD